MVLSRGLGPSLAGFVEAARIYWKASVVNDEEA
jgi:hypothetical protein